MITWESEPTMDRLRIDRNRSIKPGAQNDVASFKRQDPNPRDQALSPLGRQWMKSLPLGLRPTNLCNQYPRIVNRLALCWPDLVLRRRLFDDLLVDKRGNRQGFPPKIKEELVALSNCDGPHALTTGPDAGKVVSGIFGSR